MTESQALFSELLCNCRDNGRNTSQLFLQIALVIITMIHAILFGRKEIQKRKKHSNNNNMELKYNIDKTPEK